MKFQKKYIKLFKAEFPAKFSFKDGYLRVCTVFTTIQTLR